MSLAGWLGRVLERSFSTLWFCKVIKESLRLRVSRADSELACLSGALLGWLAKQGWWWKEEGLQRDATTLDALKRLADLTANKSD